MPHPPVTPLPEFSPHSSPRSSKARNLPLALFVLHAFVAMSTQVLAAPAPQSTKSASASVSGTYQITFNLAIASSLPASAAVVCKTTITPAGGASSGFTPQLSDSAPIETASAVATISNGTGSCLLQIPFAWVLANPRNGVVLSYAIEATSSAGSQPITVRSSSRQGIPEAFPATGSTLDLNFDVTF